MGQNVNLLRFIHISVFLTKAQMKSRYRKTIAGFMWVVLNPILLFAVHALIFKAILKINIPNYFLFLLGGLLPWVFITNNMLMTTNAFIVQREIIRSFTLSPLSLLFAHTIDNFINFLAAFFILFIGLAFYGTPDFYCLWVLPLAIISLLIFNLALATILATLQVFFRDIQFITQFVNNILYLLTPIFYPPEFIPEGFRWAVMVNPYYLIIQPFQIILNNYANRDLSVALLISFLISGATSILAYYCWEKGKKKLYHFI